MSNLKKSTSGNLRKNPKTGNLVKGCAGCCDECDCVSPAVTTILATLADLTLNAGCILIGDSYFTWYAPPLPSGDPNGTYCPSTEFSAGPCSFVAEIDVLTLTECDDPDCTDSVGEFTTFNLTITRAAGIWTATIATGTQPPIFSGSVAADDCSAGFVITNTVTGPLSIGGTLTCTPSGC